MYQIVVCDDEKEILNALAKRVEAGFAKSGVSIRCRALSDARILVEMLESEPVDILFLDIDMPYFNGMDIAKMITDQKLNILIVFVTSYDALVYRTFAYRPFAFIRKSFFEQEIDEVMERLEKELLSRKEELILQKGQDLIRLLIAEIYYMESDGNYVKIHTKNGTEKYRATMAEMECELRGKGFLRCHKGYLVNTAHISRVSGSDMEMADQSRLPVGRSYEKEVKRAILLMMRK